MFTIKRVVALSLAVALIAGMTGIFIARSQNDDRGLALNDAFDRSSISTLSADELVAGINREAVTDNQQDEAYLEGYRAGFQDANKQENFSLWADGTSNRSSVKSSRGYSDSGYVSYPQSRQRVVYTNAPKKRSFWQKHRDKLTVGIGAGSGAIIGGLLGGKKWAAIGAGIGGGGAALYTYKIRKRNKRY